MGAAMILSFKLSIKMTSDWHIGSGQGRHRSIDRLIDRDYDDLPFIPAATVRGIWRDAAQLLARGLDEDKGDAWSRFAERLFGSEPVLNPKSKETPTPSLIAVTDAIFPESLRGHFIEPEAGKMVQPEAGKKVLREALTFIKPGVSIDPSSGAAKKDFLRFEEVARGGAILEAEGEVTCEDQHAQVIAAFLLGAAAFIERLGGKRRRGMGRCSVKVVFAGPGLSNNASEAAEILEKNADRPPELQPPQRDLAESNIAPPKVAPEEWTKIPLRLTLLSPLVASDEVLGNVVTCQDHIPSGILLPPIASRLATAGLANVWALIAAGNVRVLPATPEIGGERSLPLPFCWEEEKGKKATVRWEGGKKNEIKKYQQIDHGAGMDLETNKPQPVQLRSGFVSQRQPVQHQRAVAKILRTHSTIKDEIQRPDETVGGVYSYEALAAQQIFFSEVWIRGSSVDEKELNAALDCEARLGLARQAGYGRVRIKKAQKHERMLPERQMKDRTLTVWLTTDAILSHSMGEGGLEALAGAVATALGEKAEKLFEIAEYWGNLRWRRIDGWQSRWGLPRPTLVALQAGSVAEFRLRECVSINVERLEREGIGERRGEGFGCLIANHSYLAIEPEAEQLKIPTRKQSVPPLPESPDTFVTAVWRKAWERCIALRAEAAVKDAKDREDRLGWKLVPASGKLLPNMSQLGALRAVMGELSDFEPVKAWVMRLGESKRKKDWPDEAFEKLEELIRKPESVWEKLGLEGKDKDDRFAGAPQPDRLGPDPLADPDLQRFAIRTLLLQAMRFHKRDSEPKPKKHPAEEKAA
jgi:CRISPR-associated protein Csx10